MNRSLVWREWQEMANQVCWAVAAIVFLVMTTRVVDEEKGVALTGILLAMILGNAVTASERSPRIREFLLTRPASRRRVMGTKLVLTLAFLNGTMALMILSTKLNLPGLFYGLVSETTLGERFMAQASPAFYPLGVAFANLILGVVILARVAGRSPSLGTVSAGVILAVGAMGLGRVFAYWPGERELIAWIAFLIFASAAIGVFLVLLRKYDSLEITGGGS